MRSLFEDARNIPTPLAMTSRAGLLEDIKSTYSGLLNSGIAADFNSDNGHQQVAELRRFALWLQDLTEEGILESDEQISAANVASTLLEFIGRNSIAVDSPTIFEEPLCDYLRSAILGSIGPYQAQSSFNANRIQQELSNYPDSTKVQECHRVAAMNIVSFLGRQFIEPISRSFRFQFLVDQATSELLERDADNFEFSQLDLMATISRACTNVSVAMLAGSTETMALGVQQFQSVVERARDFGDGNRYWLASRMLEVASQMGLASTHVVLKNQGVPQSFIDSLARDNVLELWEPQLDAVRQGLLEDASSNLVVAIPTGAGKTLIAELAIIKALTSGAPSWAVYVTPSRPLAGQVSSDLKRRLANSNITVRTVLAEAEQDFNLGGELETLKSTSTITITTPEKLDTYYRNAKDIFESCSLVIFDEVHKINDPRRGPLLETLISRLRINHPQARLLLLSGVMSNHEDLVAWLGQDKTKSVASRRRPTRQIRGLAIRHNETPQLSTTRGDVTTRRVDFSGGLVLAHELEDLRGGNGQSQTVEINVPDLFNGHFTGKLSQQSWRAYGQNHTTSTDHAARIAQALTKMPGSTLVFVQSIPAAQRGCRITNVDPDEFQNAWLQQLSDFVRSELGESHELVEFCKRGLAYHHGRLPSQVQRAIELGLELGALKIVFATPSLREGINSAVSNVVMAGNAYYDVDSEQRLDVSELDFENLAGRAGRPHRDTEGLVILVPDHLDRVRAIQKGKKYLLVGDDALRVISQLEDLERNLAQNDSNLVSLRESNQSLLLGLLAAGFDDEEKLSDFFGQTLWSQQLEIEENLPSIVHASAKAISEAEQLAGKEWLDLASRTGLSLSSMLSLQQDLESSLVDLTEFPEESEKLNQIIPIFLDACLKLREIKMGLLDNDEADSSVHNEPLKSWIYAKSYPEILDVAKSTGALKQNHGLNEVVKYCSDISTWLSWAFGACYLVVKSLTNVVDDSIGVLPLLTRYGVSSQAAAYISLLGVTDRLAAHTLGGQFDETGAECKFEAVSSWLESINLNDTFSEPIRHELIQRQISGSNRKLMPYLTTTAQVLLEVEPGDVASFSENQSRIFVNRGTDVVGEIIDTSSISAFSNGSLSELVGVIGGRTDSNIVSITIIRQIPV